MLEPLTTYSAEARFGDLATFVAAFTASTSWRFRAAACFFWMLVTTAAASFTVLPRGDDAVRLKNESGQPIVRPGRAVAIRRTSSGTSSDSVRLPATPPG